MGFLRNYAACFYSEMLGCLPHRIVALLHRIFVRVCYISRLVLFVLLILLRDELGFQGFAFFQIFLKIGLYLDLMIFITVQVAYVFAQYLIIFYFFNLNELKCGYFLVFRYEYLLTLIFRLENLLFLFLLIFQFLFIFVLMMVQNLIHLVIG